MTFMIFLFGIFWEETTIQNQVLKLLTKVRMDAKAFVQLIHFPNLLDRKETRNILADSQVSAPTANTPHHFILMRDESHPWDLAGPPESSCLIGSISTNSSQS